MPVTRYFLAEQVRRQLAGGDPSSAVVPEMEELRAAINQAINSLTKAEYFTETLAGGETIPEGCVITTYEGVAVTSWRDVSKATLPAMPIKLPRNMGIWAITKTDEAFVQFIPVPVGQTGFLSSQRGMSDVLGQVAYEPRGKEVIFNKDLPAQTPAITSVDMQLIVSDISKYNDYETLPINADMEEKVITAVFNQFAKNQRKVLINDTTKDNA